MAKKPSKEQIDQIISRIDGLADEEIHNEFIRMNPNSRDEYIKMADKAATIDPDELHDKISSSIHKLLLKRKPPISSMLYYFKTIERLIAKTNKNLISTNNDGSYTIDVIGVGIKLSFLEKMINTLVLDIEKGYDSIITVDLNNSKELVLRNFEAFISDELSKSPIYQKRKEIRLQAPQKLRQYLKVWELKKTGLTFDIISELVYENKSTIKKQFRRAFELIYDCKFSRDNFIKLVIQHNDRGICAECPERSTCTNLCEKVEKDIKSRGKYMREKLYGNESMDNASAEFDEISIDDIIDEDIDPESSSS